jgi:hypothetical protein
MRAFLVGLLSAGLFACHRPPLYVTAGLELASAEPAVLHRWSFDPAAHLQPPSAPSPIQVTTPHDRFLAVYGRWRIVEDATAPSAPYVLAQDQTSKEPARILVERIGFRSAIVRARCRGSCGVIFGAQSEDDYYVAQVDPGEKTVKLSRVVATVEIELARSSVHVEEGRWIGISVWTRDGDTFVSVDGEVVASSLHDELLERAEVGRVGLWSKGPAAFDDLAAMELGGKH